MAAPGRLRRSFRAHPLAADTLLAAAVTAATLAGVWVESVPLRDALLALGSPVPEPDWRWYASGLAMGTALAFRRRFPLTVLGVSTLAFGAFRITDAPEGTFSSVVPFVAVYSAGVYGRPGRATWVRALAMLGMAGTLFVGLRGIDAADLPQLSGRELRLTLTVQFAYAVLFNLLFFLAAWLLGDAVRRSRSRAAQLAERAAELERANDRIADQAVTEERVRIARELHDVVAHHVSVMGIQAGAARRVLHRDPERAAEVLGSVEASSRAAVHELQQLLGFLRGAGDPTADTVPQPTLAELGTLVERMRAAGLPVELSTDGADGELPGGVELSAYRIVQEALTNALKHGGPRARAAVLLRRDRDALRLTVSSTGDGTDRTGPPGRGLIGMRERAALHGGTVEAGHAPDGGYEVRATIPV
jgi:signal transduction histidine kinase